MSVAQPTSALSAGLALAAVFEERAIPYALGGALAYGIWGIPRATVDVDVNVFVSEAGLPNVCAAMRSLGIDIEDDVALVSSRAHGIFSATYGRFRVDVFTPSTPFSDEARRTAVARDIEGQRVHFLSAEALAVFKLLFFRRKDIADLERLVGVRRQLDALFVRRWVVQMTGEQDPRVSTWDELTRDLLGK